MICPDCNGINTVRKISIHNNPLVLCKDCNEFFYAWKEK
jgi:hypothetical protein